MYRLDFEKSDDCKAVGSSQTGYHPYARPQAGTNWPFNLNLDALVAGNQTGRQGRCQTRRTRAANLEKQRQSRINDGIVRLRQVLPDDYVHGQRMTKAKTLRFAAAYIEELTMLLRSSGPPIDTRMMTSSPICPPDGRQTPMMTLSPCVFQRQQTYQEPPMTPFPTYNATSQRQLPGHFFHGQVQGPHWGRLPGNPATGPYPGTPPLCVSSPLGYPSPSFPGFRGMPSPATPPVRKLFPEVSRAFASTELSEQYFSYTPHWTPCPQPDFVSVSSPQSQAADSDIITVDDSEDETL